MMAGIRLLAVFVREVRPGTAARAARVLLLAGLLGLWPLTWLLRLAGMLPGHLIDVAGFTDSLLFAAAVGWLAWFHDGQRQQMQKVWREQRGRMGDAVYGTGAGKVSDMPLSPGEARELLLQRAADIERRKAEATAQADPSVMQRLEATERELEMLKAGIRSVQAIAGEEILADDETRRPELKVIQGGLAS